MTLPIFMAATAQAPRAEATKARQRAGIEHAKQHRDRVYLGRKPSFLACPVRPGARNAEPLPDVARLPSIHLRSPEPLPAADSPNVAVHKRLG
jgi:hypothetical protein